MREVKHKMGSKIISLIISFAFIFNLCPVMPAHAYENAVGMDNYSYGGNAMSLGGIVEPLKNVSDLQLPKSYGKVSEIYDAGPGSKIIIQIQDLHVNSNAQKSLARLLDRLIPKYGIDVIMLEGGITDRDFSYIRYSFPRDIREKKAMKLLESGVINGENYIDIARDYALNFQGVENRALYEKNVEVSLAIDEFRDFGNNVIKMLEISASDLEAEMYPTAVKKLEKIRRGYSANKNTVSQLVTKLVSTATANGIDRGAFIQINKFADLIKMENTLDFDEIEKERQAFVKETCCDLPQEKVSAIARKAFALKTGKIGQSDFYKYLDHIAKKKGKGSDILSKYKGLSQYLLYMKKAGDIDFYALYKEMDKFYEKVVLSLLGTEEQKRLFIISKNLKIAKDMLKQHMTPEEYEYYLSVKKDFKPSKWAIFFKNASYVYGVNDPVSVKYAGKLEEKLPVLEDFYTSVVERDNGLVKNSLKELDKENASVGILIAGGFHTANLTDIFRKKGISYVVITPSIDLGKTNGSDSDKIYREALRESFENRMWAGQDLRPVSPTEDRNGYTSVNSAFGDLTFKGFIQGPAQDLLDSENKKELLLLLKKAGIDENTEAVADVFRNKRNRDGKIIDASLLNQIHQIVIDKVIDKAYDNGLDERQGSKWDKSKNVHVLLGTDAFAGKARQFYRHLFGDDHELISEITKLFKEGRVRDITLPAAENNFWFDGHASLKFVHVVHNSKLDLVSERLAHEFAHFFFNADEKTSDEIVEAFRKWDKQKYLIEDEKVKLRKDLLKKSTREWAPVESGIGVPVEEWKSFEGQAYSKPMDTGDRIVANPVKIAIDTDAFAYDKNIGLFSGVPRMIDALIRNMDGNPNVSLSAIFLSDYSEGIPSDPKRLASFLSSNDALGNAKYTVSYENGFLDINNHKIAIITRPASAEELKRLGVNVLIQAKRQNYINFDEEDGRNDMKKAEEGKLLEETEQLRAEDSSLRVIDLSPEEDILNDKLPLVVPMVNTAGVFSENENNFFRMSMPTAPTLASALLIDMLNGIVSKKNERARVVPVAGGIGITGPNRHGNRQMNVSEAQAVLGLGKILGIKEEAAGKGDLGYYFEGQPIQGASTLYVTLKVKGYLDNLSAPEINKAIQDMIQKGGFANLISYEGNPKGSASRFQTFNRAPLVILPVEDDFIKTARPPQGGPSYRLITFKCFVSDYGYAKSVLDMISVMSAFRGNKATANDKKALLKGDMPEGMIKPSDENIKEKVVPDGEEIPVVINALGRIGTISLKRLWFDPNFRLAAINAVREKDRDIKEILMGTDVVSGNTPYTVKFSQDYKRVFLEDKEERMTVIKKNRNYFTGEDNNKISLYIQATHGNLSITVDKTAVRKHDLNKAITARFNGENLTSIGVFENKDNNTVEDRYRTNSGSIIKVVYDNATMQPITVSVKKRMIVPVYNLRTDKKVYDKNRYKNGKEIDKDLYKKSVEEYNKRFAMLLRAEIPEVQGALVLETSGQMKEQARTEPFILAGARKVLVSAPTKKEVSVYPTDADLKVVPGVNNEDFLPAWDLIQTATALSCTTNGSAGALKGLMSFLLVSVGFFDTIHAITNSQGSQFDSVMAKLDRSIDARGPGGMAFSTTGASKALAEVIKELKDVLTGLSIRVGNDDGSLVKFVLDVKPKNGKDFPTKEEINENMRQLAGTPINQRTTWGAKGLKGIMGYGKFKNSLEIVGRELGGTFDPQFTKVDKEDDTVSIGVWYDNEAGFDNQYLMLALLLGLHSKEKATEVRTVAGNISPSGGFTGRTNINDAVNAGANILVIGDSDQRRWENNAVESGKLLRIKKKSLLTGETREFTGANEITNYLLQEAAAKNVPSVLNLYVPKKSFAKNEGVPVDIAGYSQILSEQITKGIKDLSVHDISRLAFSLETEAMLEPGDIQKVSDQIRKAVAETVARSLKENNKDFLLDRAKEYFAKNKGKTTDDEKLNAYVKLIGTNVSEQVRVLLNLTKGDSVFNIDNTGKILKETSIDGFILPRTLAKGAAENASEKLGAILENIKNSLDNNPNRLKVLRKYGRTPLVIYNASAGELEDVYDTAERYSDEKLEIGIMPPTAYISYLDAVKKGNNTERMMEPLPEADKVPVRVMVQNVSMGKNVTGFINVKEAVDLGQDILLGHSEIIEYLAPVNQEIAQAAKKAYELGVKGKVIIAVGETEDQRNSGDYADIVKKQILGRLDGLTSNEVARTVIAYEPRWAIGTGRTPTNDEIEEVHALIREAIRQKYGAETAKKALIIYGGSVKPDNAQEILSLRDVDGALIGGVSVKPEEFKKVVDIAADIIDRKRTKFNNDRPMYIGGNTKAYPLSMSYYNYVDMLRDHDRDKVIVSMAPTMSRLSEMREVYNSDPLKNIVFSDELTESEVYDRLVFIREDFNLPIDELKAEPNEPNTWDTTGRDLRVLASMPTILDVRKKGGISVLMTHFEPKGKKVKGPQSIEFMVPTIENVINKFTGEKIKVHFVRNPLGAERDTALRNAKPGDIILFENLRFLKDAQGNAMEKSKNPQVRKNFARQLLRGRSKGDVPIRITDGFGVVHRANQASVDEEVPGIPWLGGMLLRKELKMVDKIVKTDKPAVIVVGGTKVSDKISALKNLINNTLRPGSVVFTVGGAGEIFLKAMNPSIELGKSEGIVTPEALSDAEEIIELAEKRGIKIMTPKDFWGATDLPQDENESVDVQRVDVGSMKMNLGYYDIGPKTVESFRNLIFDKDGNLKFKTIVHIGPAGAFEYPQFRSGQQGIFDIMAEAKNKGKDDVIAIVGGGDTSYAAAVCGVEDELEISTGGGGFIEGIEGIDLPGVAALRGSSGMFSYKLNGSLTTRYARMEELAANYAAKTRFAYNFHTRSIREYKKILSDFGLTPEKLDEAAKDLQNIGSAYMNDNSRIIINPLVKDFYKKLGVSDDFFEEERTHEMVEMGLVKLLYQAPGTRPDGRPDLAGPVTMNNVLRKKLGTDNYYKFMSEFSKQYGYVYTHTDLGNALLHLIADRLDGGYVPESVLAHAADLLIEHYDLEQWFDQEFTTEDVPVYMMKQAEAGASQQKINTFEENWRALLRPKRELSSDEKAAMPLAKQEQRHAENLMETMQHVAQAKAMDNNVMVVLGENWMKGMAPGAKTRPQVEELVRTVKKYCKENGMDFYAGKDDELLNLIQTNRKDGQHVIALADAATVKRLDKKFESDKKVFLAGVNSERLQRNSYMRLMEMLDISFRIHFGLTYDKNNPDMTIQEVRPGLFIFVPAATPYKYTELKMIYKLQISA